MLTSRYTFEFEDDFSRMGILEHHVELFGC